MSISAEFLAHSAIRMANSDDEAKYLASKLRMDTDVLQALRRGTLGTFVRDLTPRGIQLKVSKSDVDTMPQMTAEEVSAVRERIRSEFSSPTSPTRNLPTSAEKPPQHNQAATSPDPVAEEAPSPPAGDKANDPGEPSETW